MSSLPLPTTREEALEVLSRRFIPLLQEEAKRPDIISWAHDRYYLAPGSSTESSLRFSIPINLRPHQQCILRLMFHHPKLRFTTMLYSTVKKSGKTAIGGLVARYLAETSGYYAEVYCLANDEEQARGRIYKAAIDSVENTPGYDEHKHILPMTSKRREIVDAMHGSRAAATENEWRIIERQAEYTPTHSFIKALSSDYRGEAGANPTATVWSEIWGLDSEKSKKLWAELTPVPTRNSIRFVETYAGYEGESLILEDVWALAMKGHQLTRDELHELSIQALHDGIERGDPEAAQVISGRVPNSGNPYMYDWPNDEPGYRGHDYNLPLWINEDASLIAYIDQGVEARRMPWQKGERGEAYYKEEEHTLEPIQVQRFHHNEWTSTISPFIDIQWWRNCSIRKWDVEKGWWSHELKDGHTALRPLTKQNPVVLCSDAAVSNDYMATGMISREGPHKVALRGIKVWRPEDQPNGRFDYEYTIVPHIKDLCTRFNVVEWTFDPFQLHKVGTDLERDYVCTCWPFNQNQDRLRADKQLHDLIRDQEIVYDPLEFEREDLEAFEMALRNCAMKMSKDEDTRYRIIKKSSKGKIDPVIAVSMGAERCLYLNLWGMIVALFIMGAINYVKP